VLLLLTSRLAALPRLRLGLGGGGFGWRGPEGRSGKEGVSQCPINVQRKKIETANYESCHQAVRHEEELHDRISKRFMLSAALLLA